MNLRIFNISESCFGMYSLFFFSFDGFDMLDVLSFLWTFDIQILLNDQCITRYSINIKEKWVKCNMIVIFMDKIYIS